MILATSVIVKCSHMFLSDVYFLFSSIAKLFHNLIFAILYLTLDIFVAVLSQDRCLKGKKYGKKNIPSSTSERFFDTHKYQKTWVKISVSFVY